MKQTLLVLSLLLTLLTNTSEAKPVDYKVTEHFNLKVTIKAGDWQGFGLGNCEDNTIYWVDITPSGSNYDGAHIKHFIQRETDGKGVWNDVLRVQAPEKFKDTPVVIKVYKVDIK